jgi:hypothetical protein
MARPVRVDHWIIQSARDNDGLWAHSCLFGEPVSEASLTPRHHVLAQGRYATMAERGKAGVILIGARVTEAASPGFVGADTGTSGARLGAPDRSRLRACESS